MDALVENHGPLWIYGLVRRSKSIHSWDILLCATWASKGDSKIVHEIDGLLKRMLKPSENEQVGRILVVPEGDPFLEQFFSRIGGVYDQSQIHIVGPLFGDESIIEAYVLAADNPHRTRRKVAVKSA